jgi:uncharacterized protein YdeI (YjbR/CyaY-like superfamily)
MEITRTLTVRSRQEWRSWLSRHHADTQEIWVVYYKKGSGRTGIGYEESVEEALCFGWIDGQNRTLDEKRFAGRFTPRRPRSSWSESNRTRVRKLMAEGRMTDAGIAVLPEDLKPSRAPSRRLGGAAR